MSEKAYIENEKAAGYTQMKNSVLLALTWILLLPFRGVSLDAMDARFFGGGMAIQAGYVSLENKYGAFDGIISGLGGRLHFYLGTIFRIGGAGAAVKLFYEDPGLEESYVRIGYGGLTAEITRSIGSWQVSLGLLAGGGGFRNLHIISKNDDTTIVAFLDVRTTLVLSPIVTIERKISDAISLMGMVDYLWGPDLGEKQYLGWPKVHIGVLFGK